MPHSHLEIDGFYWVLPNWDVDFIPPGFEDQNFSDEMHKAMCAHWSQNQQPAKFSGFTPEGKERWTFLGQDDPEPGEDWWGVRWIGSKIVA